MNTRFLSLTALLALTLCFSMNLKPSFAAEELVVADFDTGDKPNNLGGDFGGWDKDPNDETQGTKMSFEADDAMGDPAGYAIRLDYDVDSPNPAYNGFWIKMNGEDATLYNTLNFYIKGHAEAGFTKRVKLELKDMTNKPSPYIVGGITEQWQKISIPFEKFRRISDWSALNELILVFDDINSNPKKGTILIDQITLSKE
ncbi:MAG: hypothetical protein FGM27_00670 [Candidatus Omnitrophica bacterium]|nr:hypothetical protein [Candidatus Omnitrophota bacterium]